MEPSVSGPWAHPLSPQAPMRCCSLGPEASPGQELHSALRFLGLAHRRSLMKHLLGERSKEWT